MQEDPRYAPPVSPLHDVDAEREVAERPRQVRWASALLWSNLTLGIAVTVYSMQRSVDVGEYAPGVTAVIVAFSFAMFALNAFLNVMIYKGRNWARITYLVIAVLGFAFLFLPSEETPTDTEMVGYVVGTALDLAAMVLVFTRPGALWFSRRR